MYGYGIDNETENDTMDVSQKECHFVVDGNVQTTAPYSVITAQIWIVVIIFVGFTFLGRVVGFTSVNVLVSNSCKRSVRGSVNGLATSGASLARAIGPMLGATVFAWSESNDHFPVNYHFIFICTVVINFLTVGVVWFLPSSITKQKEENDESNQEMIRNDGASVDDSEQIDRDGGDLKEETDKVETCESVV
jgi:MFS family permease